MMKLYFAIMVLCGALSSCNGGGSSRSSVPVIPTVDTPSLSLLDQLVVEKTGPVLIAVSLSKAPEATVSVEYRFVDGTAIANQDYENQPGLLTFAAGVSEAFITVQLIDDGIGEAVENFYLEFFAADGLQIITDLVTISITDSGNLNWEVMSEFEPNWEDLGAFSNAESCGRCHSASVDSSGVLRFPKQADGDDISPYGGWQHTMMAHSFNDPYFQAVVQDEVEHFPSLAGTIEDKCLTCHSPMAHNFAHTSGTNLSTGDCLKPLGCYRMDTAHEQMPAREGISCTLCHQIDPGNLGTTFSGGFSIDDVDKTIYGPYPDPLLNPMAINTQYTVAGGSHMQGSSLCAVCHDLKTPSVNVLTGELTGNEFVEQSPYAEWFNSTFNEGDSGDSQCQDCHMTSIDGYMTQIATKGNGTANLGWPERSDYSQHLFLGSNSYQLGLLKEYRDELGISNTTTEQGFDNQISNNQQFMTQLAADISIESVALNSTQLSIDVTITNKAGHKLPTSFPSRRAWLNLVVKDASGMVLFESGTPDQYGELVVDSYQAGPECTEAEKPISYDASKCYSPHYDVITKSDEIAIYESVMADTSNHVTYVLLHADSYLKDNRIPPSGFKQTGPRYNPDSAIIGAADLDADFNYDAGIEGAGIDTVHYQLDWQGLSGTSLQIEAKLYYQTIRPAFVTGLLQSGDKIDRFNSMYQQNREQPIILASDSEVY